MYFKKLDIWDCFFNPKVLLFPLPETTDQNQHRDFEKKQRKSQAALKGALRSEVSQDFRAHHG